MVWSTSRPRRPSSARSRSRPRVGARDARRGARDGHERSPLRSRGGAGRETSHAPTARGSAVKSRIAPFHPEQVMRASEARWDAATMQTPGLVTLAASQLEAARSQMAFTLGFHIILASLGVALPAMMLIANYRGLRRGDEDAMLLARRWSKVVAVTFAVGAVTGTVLSFEFGLLWPAFTGRFGQVFGVLFAIEGICFFLEAIFVAIYIFGWKRLAPWTHLWAGVPIVITGLGGAFSVVAVNSWMNQPQGYSPTTGDVTSVEPLKVIFNPAVPYEVPHMILAAYLVTGFLVASVYAVG